MKEINLLENSILENKNGLYRLAYSYVRNKEDSLDIVQFTKRLKTINQIR